MREKKNEIINRIKQVGINFQTYCIIEEELKTKNGWTKEEFYRMYPSIQDYYENFKDNKYWIIKAIIVQEREQRKCRDCKEYSAEVHHLKHPYYNPKMALADSNLVPLCSDCHQIRHNKRQTEAQKRKDRFR